MVPTDATGNVTIYVNDNIARNVSVANGTAILILDKPVGGIYNVNVTYRGDSKYAPKDKNSTKFRVDPDNHWSVNITGEYNTYGEYSTINITDIPDDFAPDT